MGPAVRDLSRELHFRFLGLAKYLRSRQKAEFCKFLASLQIFDVENSLLFPTSTSSVWEQDHLVCVKFRCKTGYSVLSWNGTVRCSIPYPARWSIHPPTQPPPYASIHVWFIQQNINVKGRPKVHVCMNDCLLITRTATTHKVKKWKEACKKGSTLLQRWKKREI